MDVSTCVLAVLFSALAHSAGELLPRKNRMILHTLIFTRPRSLLHDLAPCPGQAATARARPRSLLFFLSTLMRAGHPRSTLPRPQDVGGCTLRGDGDPLISAEQ